jgi:hypothetical protein
VKRTGPIVIVCILTAPVVAIPVLSELLTFIPWFIAGHGLGICHYEHGRKSVEVRVVVRDVTKESETMIANVEVEIRLGAGGPVLDRPVTDENGRVRVDARRLVEWTRGRSECLVALVRKNGGQVLSCRIDPGEVLSDSGHPIEWRSLALSAAPVLTVSGRFEDGWIVVRFENNGEGDAYQVAALLSGMSSVEGKALAVGHLRSGKSVERRIAVPDPSGHVRIEVSEALERSPGAIDVDW